MSSQFPSSSRNGRPAAAVLLFVGSLVLVLGAATAARSAGSTEAAVGTPGAAYPLAPPPTLFPGDQTIPPENPQGKTVQGNPQAIAQGKELFTAMNCVGCHFHGAGGIGPALMDRQWIYGGRIDEIYASIKEGRPNGMPAWGGKLPDRVIWDIAAYVKSMSASAPKPYPGGGQVISASPPPPEGPEPKPTAVPADVQGTGPSPR